jgi:hypothetical protein
MGLSLRVVLRDSLKSFRFEERQSRYRFLAVFRLKDG